VLNYSEFNEYLLTYLSPEQCQQVHKAFLLAQSAHQTQTRLSGEPYITHPFEVAKILSTFQLDHETIQAGLLHDVLEDTAITKEELAAIFSESVAHLVDGVSKLKQIKFSSRAHEQAENLCKMMFAVAHDIRVLLIKLADRLHNMRTIGVMPTEKKNRKAIETLEIYAPIAYRLGMNALKMEFEDLGFINLYPYRYSVIAQAIQRTRAERESLLREVQETIFNTLKTYGVQAHQLSIREKSPYSVYRKMQRHHLKFKDINELFGFRIVVYSLQDCYRVLGILHNVFKPIINKFKDYIAIPKTNGYRSLHTVLIVKHNIVMEFQIRTIQMHLSSEYGIAAHSRNHSESLSIDKEHYAQQWVNDMIELQSNSYSSLEFIEHMKMDLDPDEVYVFDEKGEIWTLPKGSTPIDLAYARSAQEARHCVACSINRLLAPLSTPLQSGQTIKLIFSPHAAPNPGWLTFAITGKARSYIRNWLRNQQYEHSIDLGKRLLIKELESINKVLDDLTPLIPALLEKFRVTQINELYSSIGLGKCLANTVMQSIQQMHYGVGHEDKKIMPLHLNGEEGIVLEYAHCCYPISGDAIVGVIKAGTGLIVHRENCTQLKTISKEESILCLAWDIDEKMTFQVKIELQLLNKIGALALIAGILSEHEINILAAKTKEIMDPRLNDLELVITVRDRDHLAMLLKRLRKTPFVHRIKRL